MAANNRQAQVVAPEVSQRKLAEELDQWRSNQDAYAKRGWILKRTDEVEVEVAFCASVALTGGAAVSVITCAARINFLNYDVWAPSVEFIDFMTGDFVQPPVRAFIATADGARDLLVDTHPVTGRPFLCVPGTREYHTHPQHSGDDWLLHRPMKAGTLAAICDRLWRTMARNVTGLQATFQTLPFGLVPQLDIRIGQGDTEALQQQVLAQQPTSLVLPAGLSVQLQP